MILYKTKHALKEWLVKRARGGKSVGFVPTMGALHQGHLSLLNKARAENEFTVSSIFVNPTQFNDLKDYNKYPVTLEKDVMMLEPLCDVLFVPSVEEMYPDGMKSPVHYDLGYIETILEGKFRPGHFQGVSMVVDTLLKTVNPGKLYLGQKDYQQCMVISRLLQLTASNTTLVISPTLREDSGLAMSSRNMRLSDLEKSSAKIIYQTLIGLKQSVQLGPVSAQKLAAVKALEEAGLRVDYLEIADARTLLPVEVWDGSQKMVALIAAYMNEVRLIDNMLLN